MPIIDKKISGMPQATTIDGTETVVVVQDGTTKKVTVSQVAGAAITQAQVAKLDALPTNAQLTAALAGKEDAGSWFDNLWTAAADTYGGVDHSHTEGAVCKPYLLNGLWLTFDEALAVYIAGPVDSVYSQYRYMDKKIRTNLPPNIRGLSWGASTDIHFRLDNIVDGSDIEVLNLAMPAGSNNMCLAFVTGDFYGTRYFNGSKLKKIIGPLDLSKSKEGTQGQHFFGLCPLLEYFEGSYLREDLDLGGCPKLNDAAFRYLILNRNPLEFAYHDVTITVHADVYAKLTAHLDSSAPAYASRDTAWDDLLDLAASKKITFASA